MKTLKKRFVFIGLSMMMLSGCGREDKKAFWVDEYMFMVPREYLIEGTIPWLPASQHDGLTFALNPKAPLQDRVSVLLQSTFTTCPQGQSLGTSPLASACLVARNGGSNEEEANGDIVKVHPNNDPVQWEYHVEHSNDGASSVVATCSALANGDGLCHAFGNYGDLVFSVGLRDSQMAGLSQIRKEIVALLTSWRKNSGRDQS